MGKIKLKPCPFCGGHPNLIYDSPVLYGDDHIIENEPAAEAYIQCSRCGVETLYRPIEKTVEMWNTREVIATEA